MTSREPDRCSAPYRVRFDEGAPDGRLRTSVLLRYTQDLAGVHSAARGFSRAWYAERGITWLVRAAEIAIERPIDVGADLVGTTWVVGWRRVRARRRTEFHDAAGTRVAWVHIDWILIDGDGSPARIPPDFDPVFRAPASAAAIGRVSLERPAGAAVRMTMAVRPHELDPLGHVNNAVYADWVDEAVLAAGGLAEVRAVPRSVRLEYARAIDAGAEIAATAWPGAPGVWSVRITDEVGADLLRARLEPGSVPAGPDQPGSAPARPATGGGR